MMRLLRTLWAFLKRDFLSEVSYRLSFVLQIFGLLMSLSAFYFMTKMIDPNAEGLGGMPPFQWYLLGLAFQYYFSAALFAFSAKIRNEQMLGTLEAMLVSPTPTSVVIFASATWDFTYAGFRVIVYLLFATLIFGVRFHTEGLGALALGILLTLLSSVGLGILSASFVVYFKRGNPINFFLSGMTTFFGSVFFPVEQLPSSLRWISDYLPITWALRVIRGALGQGKTLADLGPDLRALALLTAIILPAGLIMSQLAIRRAKREGSLIQY